MGDQVYKYWRLETLEVGTAELGFGTEFRFGSVEHGVKTLRFFCAGWEEYGCKGKDGFRFGNRYGVWLEG